MTNWRKEFRRQFVTYKDYADGLRVPILSTNRALKIEKFIEKRYRIGSQ